MIVLVMGVSGSGKTTIGERLAARLGCGFSDADQFHSPANKAKMSRGIALTDADRQPWLLAIRAAIDEQRRQGRDHVFACSALKRRYRELLRGADDDLRLVYLQGPPDLLARRLRQRKGHFFAPELLADQLATLEPPAPDEALVMDIRQPPEVIVERIAAALGSPPMR
jgi:gluconokinase